MTDTRQRQLSNRRKKAARRLLEAVNGNYDNRTLNRDFSSCASVSSSHGEKILAGSKNLSTDKLGRLRRKNIDRKLKDDLLILTAEGASQFYGEVFNIFPADESLESFTCRDLQIGTRNGRTLVSLPACESVHIQDTEEGLVLTFVKENEG